MPRGAENKEELAALAVDEHHAAHGREAEIESVKRTYPQCA